MRVRIPIAVCLAVATAACSSTARSPFFATLSPVTLLDRVPVAGESDAPLDSAVEAEFSGPVSTVGISGSFRLFLASTNSTPIGSQYFFEENNRVVRLVPNAPLALGADYIAKLERGFPDARGRPMAGFSWNFHTTNPADAAIVRLAPGIGHTVPPNFVLRATFTEPLAMDSIAAVRATVVASPGGPMVAQASYDADGNALLFRLPQNAPANASITVLVSASNLTDALGRSIPSSVFANWTFSTTATGDYAMPVVTGSASFTAVENPAGSGIADVSIPTSTDNAWLPADMWWVATFSRLEAQSIPGGCADPFQPEVMRRAVIGSAGSGTISVSGLSNGTWSVSLVAEDGSGRRSPVTAPRTFDVAAGAVAFDPPVKAILHDRCSFDGCHLGPNSPGYMDTSGTRDQIVSYQSKVPGKPIAVQPYCLSESYLWWKLVPGYDTAGALMPPDYVDTPALTRRERATIEAWIRQGAN